jgi:hypothetical protein
MSTTHVQTSTEMLHKKFREKIYVNFVPPPPKTLDVLVFS